MPLRLSITFCFQRESPGEPKKNILTDVVNMGIKNCEWVDVGECNDQNFIEATLPDII